MKLLILIFLLSSCAAAPEKVGYYVDDKPYKGTREFNREYVRPFWQCVFMNTNIDCKE
tara:strand:- start:32 stop:205 length:174 start_codon:yes stop_codon:yes gene_type:complete